MDDAINFQSQGIGMNDQLQQALAVVLQGATNAVQSGVSFLQAELPDVIQQLLTWKLAQAGLHSLLCLAVIVVFVVSLNRGLPIWKAYSRGSRMYYGNVANDEEKEGRRLMQENDDGDSFYKVLAAVSGPLSVVAAVIFLEAFGTVVQIWLAPKIYLIEYAARLAGK